jgi:hypothetical protein
MMIFMPMTPFFSKFPEIAALETRSVIIYNNKKIPDGIYGLYESFCDEDDCDCRRVFINVISKDSMNEILATITYGWDTPEFYRKWMKYFDNELIEMMTHPHLEIRQKQSKYANDFLDIFLNVIKDKEYVERIIRHYFLFKEAANKKSHETKSEKIGRNEICSCGSGKKYKKCCGGVKQLRID